MFGNGVSVVVSMLVMIGIGMLLCRLGWVTPRIDDFLAKSVTNVALPCMSFHQLLTNYHRAELLTALPALGLAYGSIGALYALSIPLSRLLRIPEKRRGTFRATFSFGNTIFIGLPINTALYGAAALPATLMYYLANTTLFWTLGANGIQTDGGAPRRRLFSRATLRRLLTPPMIAIAVCIALVLLEAPRVPPLMRAAEYMGNLVTPLSLLFVGGMLYRMLRQGVRWQRGYGAFVLSRFVLSPALILSLIYAFGGLPPLWRSAFLVQASMPAQSSSAIVAHSFHADAEYATGGITITTLLSMLTIPLFAALSAALP
jgi:predicted permease